MSPVKGERESIRSFTSNEKTLQLSSGDSLCRMTGAVVAMLDQDQLGSHIFAIVRCNLSLPEPDFVRWTLATQLDQHWASIFKELVLDKKSLLVRQKRQIAGDFGLVVSDANHVRTQDEAHGFRDVSYLLPGPGVSWIEVVKSLLKPLLRYCLACVVRVRFLAVMLSHTAITDSPSQSRSPEKDLVRDHQTRKEDQE